MRDHVLSSSAFLVASAVLATGCDGGAKELTARLSEANDRVIECKKGASELRSQVSSLKREVARALAKPSSIQLQDPEIIELVADLRKQAGATDEVLLGKGALDPKVASKVVKGGAQMLQICYERALKKSTSLQYQAGLGVVLGVTVKPTGIVEEVDVRPSVDHGMTECIRGAAMRWKFPKFAGDSVTIEQKITLTPKT